MINEIFEFSDKIEKLLVALRIKFMFEIMAIVLIGMVVFKLIDLFDSKLKAKLTLSNNSPLTRFVPILSNIFKGVVVFFLLVCHDFSYSFNISAETHTIILNMYIAQFRYILV